MPRLRITVLLLLSVVLIFSAGCDDDERADDSLPLSGSEPAFNPSDWNRDPPPDDFVTKTREERLAWLLETPEGQEYFRKVRIQLRNNCYNYACNKKITPPAEDPAGDMGIPAEPGRGGAFTPPNRWCTVNEAGQEVLTGADNPARSLCTADITCEAITAAARADGLISQDCETACPAGSYKKALVLDPLTDVERADSSSDLRQTDYHWFRQDASGNWSHKRGEGPASNGAMGAPDGSGRGDPITDPRKPEARRNYTEFCGCFCCGPDVTKAGLFLPSLTTLFAPLFQPQSAAAEVLVIEEILFSGRSNPRWEIRGEDQLQEVARRLRNLPPSSNPDWPENDTGGFLIYTESLTLLGSFDLFPIVRVKEGVVEIDGHFFSDGQNLAAWIRQNWPSGTQ